MPYRKAAKHVEHLRALCEQATQLRDMADRLAKELGERIRASQAAKRPERRAVPRNR